MSHIADVIGWVGVVLIGLGSLTLSFGLSALTKRVQRIERILGLSDE